VFKVDTAPSETVLYSFTGKADGAYPEGGLIRDSAGNLYGTADGGGPAQAGVVFKLDATGQETVLYSFLGTDGGYPWAGVIRDPGGNLYGTTTGGGAAGVGVVYKIDATGHETVLHSFMGGTDGANPNSGVIRDSAGNLYGATNGGGTYRAGTVYKLDPTGQETLLYTFTGGADGAGPNGVIRDSAGNLYGTTGGGGSAGAGLVYKLDTTGHQTVLYSFTGGVDGGGPSAGVIPDSSGNLYGTTWSGGTSKAGVVYKLTPAGQETVLYSFTDGTDGGHPSAGVVRDSAGNLYGTTWSGGPPSGDYPGVVYKVDPSGNETVVYGFSGFADGNSPRGGVILDADGNLYGTTEGGGSGNCYINGCGVVFEVNADGQETVLYTFASGISGNVPEAGVILDAAGNLYGTTNTGGKAGAGVVYKLTDVASPE
jgi:uncharacterized repeat protein (TIGR03803 family)